MATRSATNAEHAGLHDPQEVVKLTERPLANDYCRSTQLATTCCRSAFLASRVFAQRVSRTACERHESIGV